MMMMMNNSQLTAMSPLKNNNTSSTNNMFDQEIDLDIFFSFDLFENDFNEVNEVFSFESSTDPVVSSAFIDPFDEVSLLSDESDLPVLPSKRNIKNNSNNKKSLKRKHDDNNNTFSRSTDVMEIKSETSQRSAKRVRSNMDSTTIIPPTTTIITLLTPEEYANKIIKTLNCGDLQEMQEQFQQLCSNNVKITKHFYPTIEELRTKEEINRVQHKKQEDYLSTMEFQHLSEFLHYVKMYNLLVPDGAFSVDNSRCCFEAETSSVFMSTFNYSGTLLCGNMNLFSNKMSLLNLNEQIITQSLNQSCIQKSFQQLKTEGSMALYVNQTGLITSIEFYETRRVLN